jgi:hypothetical protein
MAAIAGVVVALGLVAGAPVPAGAQAAATPDAAMVAAAIELKGWYADPGANPGPDRLTALAASFADDRHPIAFAVLAAAPPESSQSYAYDVVDALPADSKYETVVVLSPDDIGIDSDYWDDSAVDATLDATTDAVRADPGAGLAILATDLAHRRGPSPDGSSDDGTGTPGGILVVGVIVIVASAVISWLGRGEQYERWGDDDEPYWDRRRRYQRYTSWSSRSSGGGWRSSSSSSHRSFSSGSSHRSSSSGHSHRGSGGRRL